MPITLSRFAFALAVGLALASAAPRALFAQPGDLVPLADFRQHRPALPGGGSMYCGPAAATDVIHWLHEHGYPLVAAPSAEDAGCDPDVDGDLALSATVFIEELGEDMGTDAVGGTASPNIVEVLQARLEAAYPGRFTVGLEGRLSEDDAARNRGRSFATIVEHLEAGNLVVVNVGWYVLDGTDDVRAGTRCGGHLVAMTGYDDPVPNDGEYTSRFADPGRDCLTVTRREVSRRSLTLEFPDDEYILGTVSSWNWERNATDCSDGQKRYGFQDNVIAVAGTCLFSPSPAQLAIECVDLSQLTAGEPTLYPTPIEVDCVAVHPSLRSVWSCAGADAIQCTELLTGRTSAVPIEPELTDVAAMLFGPDSTLYILDRPSDGAPPVVHAVSESGRLFRSVTPAGRSIAMTFHEATNRLLIFDAVKKEIVMASPRLGSSLGTLPVPGLSRYAEPVHMAADPRRGVLYLHHEGSSSILRIDIASGALLGEISTREMQNPGSMAVDNNGRLFVATERGGPVLNFLDGALERTQLARGYSAGGSLALLRAGRRPLRERYAGGELNNDPPVEDETAVFLRGDCNGDGVADISDAIFDLNRLFGGGQRARCADACDTNGDGTGDISDAVYLLAHSFLGRDAPPAPFPRCGVPSRPGRLGCEEFGCGR